MADPSRPRLRSVSVWTERLAVLLGTAWCDPPHIGWVASSLAQHTSERDVHHSLIAAQES